MKHRSQVGGLSGELSKNNAKIEECKKLVLG
jgi:hypothetical protein